MEQGKSTGEDKRKAQEGKTPLRLNTNASVDGGSKCSNDENSIMESEPWNYTARATINNFCQRMEGTPQGRIISPLLANLLLHYAF